MSDTIDRATIERYRDGALSAAFEALTKEWSQEQRDEIAEALKLNPRFYTPETANIRAQQSKLAIRGLQGARDASGQAILAELWFDAENGIYLCDGDRTHEYNTLSEWVETELASAEDDDIEDTGDQIVTDDYILRLARVVERIFVDVKANERTGAFYDEDGEKITVDRLINTPKLTKKLLRASFTYAELTDKVARNELDPADAKEKKRDLLSTVLLSKSAAVVARKCDRLQQETGSAIYQYREVQVQGGINFTIENMQTPDVLIVKKLLKGMLASA